MHGGTTEALTCVGGWGGGQLYYAALDSPSKASWRGPVTTEGVTHATWDFFAGQSAIFGKCKAPASCDAGVHHLGAFPSLAACQAAVNATRSFKVASYTYQHNVSSLGAYAGHCYAMSTFDFAPTPQVNTPPAPPLHLHPHLRPHPHPHAPHQLSSRTAPPRPPPPTLVTPPTPTPPPPRPPPASPRFTRRTSTLAVRPAASPARPSTAPTPRSTPRTGTTSSTPRGARTARGSRATAVRRCSL